MHVPQASTAETKGAIAVHEYEAQASTAESRERTLSATLLRASTAETRAGALMRNTTRGWSTPRPCGTAVRGQITQRVPLSLP